MFEIEYYETDNVKIPVYDFINILPVKLRVKVFASLKILSEYGNNLREPYPKYIDKGIFELRIKFSTDITRIFYFFIKDNKIILTNGYVKKQNQMDNIEYNKALKYKEDYERREKKWTLKNI